jgi:hypothetical protein
MFRFHSLFLLHFIQQFLSVPIFQQVYLYFFSSNLVFHRSFSKAVVLGRFTDTGQQKPGFLLGLLIDPEDGNTTFLRNVGGLLTDTQHYVPEDIVLHEQSRKITENVINDINHLL